MTDKLSQFPASFTFESVNQKISANRAAKALAEQEEIADQKAEIRYIIAEKLYESTSSQIKIIRKLHWSELAIRSVSDELPPGISLAYHGDCFVLLVNDI